MPHHDNGFFRHKHGLVVIILEFLSSMLWVRISTFVIFFPHNFLYGAPIRNLNLLPQTPMRLKVKAIQSLWCVDPNSVFLARINAIKCVDSRSMLKFWSQKLCYNPYLIANRMNPSLWFLPFLLIQEILMHKIWKKSSITSH